LVYEFTALYSGQQLPPLKLRYKDYSLWQTSEKVKKRLKHQEGYWLDKFKGEIRKLKLPTDYPRPALQSFEGNRLRLELGKDQAGELKKIALEEGATLYMVLLALFNIFLAKICGREEIIIGVPVAGRQHEDLHHIIGVFVNTLALRNYPRGEKAFNEFLQEVKTGTLEAFENQDYPLEELVARVGTRSSGGNPLFDVAFDIDYIGNREVSPGKGAGEFDAGVYDEVPKISKFDLGLYVLAGETLLFIFIYSTKLFKNETIEKFIAYFNDIITGVLENKHIKINDIKVSYDLIEPEPDDAREEHGDFDFKL
jgi:non-ribosomal peptide synthetase component F